MGPDDYFFFLWARLHHPAIQLFEHGTFTCPPQARVYDANLPSFVAWWNVGMLSQSAPQTKRRTLTSVSTGTHTYSAYVVHPQGFKIAVEPATLTFSPDALKQSFTVTLTPDGTLGVPQCGSAGSVIWWDGQHVVSSPLVAMNVDLW